MSEKFFSKDFYKDKPHLKVGDGSEKEVFQHPQDPKKVVGIFRNEVLFPDPNGETKVGESPELIKARFYLTKILKLLLPDNFTYIHLSASKPKVAISDKVQKPNTTVEISEEEASSFFYKIKEAMGVKLDCVEENFIRSPRGNFQYVDSIEPWVIYIFEDNSPLNKIEKNYSIEKIKNALDTLNPEQKEKGLIYLNRLEKLFEEEKNKFQEEIENKN